MGRSETLEREDSGEPRAKGAPRRAAADASLVGCSLLHFRVVARLGEGGMGTVYKAIDDKLRRPVALKVLSPRYRVDDRNAALLFREARSAAAVAHPNIAAIHELHDEHDPPFIVMELVDGEPLRARVTRGPLSVTEATAIGREIADALARAHRAGIVHRDLKPENVMLTREGHAKVLDFGLAKADREPEPVVAGAPIDSPDAHAATLPAASHRTAKGRVVGTPAYMAPEQARGEAIDARSDVFAFGVLLYELLTAQQPFDRASQDPRSWGDSRSSDWRLRAPLRRVNRRVPRALQRVVQRCLAIDARDRYSDGSALSEALRLGSVRAPRLWGALLAALGIAALLWGARSSRTRGVPTTAGPSAVPRSAVDFDEVRLDALAERDIEDYAVSADARSIAVIRDGGVVLRGLRGGDWRPLRIPEGWALHPGDADVGMDFFPDGRRLLLSTRSSEQSASVAIVATDGTTPPQRLPDVPGKIAVLSRGGDWMLVFPPDGMHARHLDGSGDRLLRARSPGEMFTDWSWSSADRIAVTACVCDAQKNPVVTLDVITLEGASRRLASDPVGTGIASVDWHDDDRLLMIRGGALLGRKLVEQSVGGDGSFSGEPRVLREWPPDSEVGRLLSVGDEIVVSRGASRDDLYVADVTEEGTVHGEPRPLTDDHNRNFLVGRFSTGEIVYATSRVGSLELDAASESGAVRRLASFPGQGSLPDVAAAVAPGDAVLAWRRDGGRCALERIDLGGASKRLQVTEPTNPEDPLACQSVIRCSRDRCFTTDVDAGARTFRRLDPESGATLDAVARWKGRGNDWIWDVSPDGSTLAFGERREFVQAVVSFDIAAGTGKDIATTPNPDGIHALRYAPDGKSLLMVAMVGSENRIQRIDPDGRVGEMWTTRKTLFGPPLLDASKRRLAFAARMRSTDLWLLTLR